MTQIFFTCDARGRILYEENSKDFHEGTLMHYLRSEGTIWSYLIDPSIKNDTYSPGNYFFTRRDSLYLYIAEDYYLDDDDPEQEFKPTVVLLNTMLGLLIAFKYMRTHKIPEFTLTLENKHYTFTGPAIKTIVVDPDLGNLYNETIPRIIARRINGVFEYDLCPANNPENQHIYLLPKLLEKNYAQDLFITLHEWPNRMANWQESEKKARYGSVGIENGGDVIELKDKTKGIGYSGWLIITKESLKKFLQAWDSHLQFCDSFTLVFLGRTLRFFEGEPLPPQDDRERPIAIK